LANIRHLPRPAESGHRLDAGGYNGRGAMIWSLFHRNGWLSPGERARREHEVWLSRAIRSGRALPRIPARRVDLGGMEPVLGSPRGREWARRWWERVLSRADLS
jgi:hypothetical protein